MITAADIQALMYDLPVLLAASRGRRGMSMHAAAHDAGVSSSTIHRIEGGYSCDVYTLILILRWIEIE